MGDGEKNRGRGCRRLELSCMIRRHGRRLYRDSSEGDVYIRWKDMYS